MKLSIAEFQRQSVGLCRCASEQGEPLMGGRKCALKCRLIQLQTASSLMISKKFHFVHILVGLQRWMDGRMVCYGFSVFRGCVSPHSDNV